MVMVDGHMVVVGTTGPLTIITGVGISMDEVVEDTTTRETREITQEGIEAPPEAARGAEVTVVTGAAVPAQDGVGQGGAEAAAATHLAITGVQ